MINLIFLSLALSGVCVMLYMNYRAIIRVAVIVVSFGEILKIHDDQLNMTAKMIIEIKATLDKALLGNIIIEANKNAKPKTKPTKKD